MVNFEKWEREQIAFMKDVNGIIPPTTKRVVSEEVYLKLADRVKELLQFVLDSKTAISKNDMIQKLTDILLTK